MGQSLFGRLRELAQTYLSDSKQWSRVDGYETVSAITPPPPAIGLSGHAAEMFVHFSYDLSATFKTLLPRLFTTLWQPVLRKINQLLYNKVRCQFSVCSNVDQSELGENLIPLPIG